MAKSRTKSINSLTNEELFDSVYNRLKRDRDKQLTPGFSRPQGMTEDAYKKQVNDKFDYDIARWSELKGNRKRLLNAVSGFIKNNTSDFLPEYMSLDVGTDFAEEEEFINDITVNTQDIAQKSGKAYKPPVTSSNESIATATNRPQSIFSVLDNGGITQTIDLPEVEIRGNDPVTTPKTTATTQATTQQSTQMATEPTINDVVQAASERKTQQAGRQTDYLNDLYDKYQQANAEQTAISSAANLLNLGADIWTRKKTLDELETPDITVPGKDVVRLRRPDVRTPFERLASRTVNTGLTQAREMGRPDLIPSILSQGSEISEKGILEQGIIDTEVNNKQSIIDMQINDAFAGRRMQAEGLKFQSEDQMRKARAGVYSAFGQQLKQNFSAQADIMNKSIISPIAVEVDWLDKYGFTNKGILNQTIT